MVLDQRPGLIELFPVVRLLPYGSELLQDQLLPGIRYPEDLHLVPGDERIPLMRYLPRPPGTACGDEVAAVEHGADAAAVDVAGMHPDDYRPVPVAFPDGLGILGFAYRDGEPLISFGVSELRALHHVDWHSFRIDYVVPSHGIEDNLQGGGLHQARDPSAEALQDVRVGDHGGPAAIGGYHGGTYPPVLEGGAQDLRDAECDVVIGAHHAVLRAESEIPDAELDVLPDHLRRDGLHPPELLEQRAVFQFGFADGGDFPVLYHHAGHADGIEYVSAVIDHALTILCYFHIGNYYISSIAEWGPDTGRDELMETILVRYCEIGLKSDPVRRRFEGILKRNMIEMLAGD